MIFVVTKYEKSKLTTEMMKRTATASGESYDDFNNADGINNSDDLPEWLVSSNSDSDFGFWL